LSGSACRGAYRAPGTRSRDEACLLSGSIAVELNALGSQALGNALLLTLDTI
jgi:hypothetical protein